MKKVIRTRGKRCSEKSCRDKGVKTERKKNCKDNKKEVMWKGLQIRKNDKL